VWSPRPRTYLSIATWSLFIFSKGDIWFLCSKEVEDVEMAEIAEMCGAAFEAFEAYCMLVSSSDGKDLKQLSRQPWLDDRGAGLRHVSECKGELA
jgi:hypothetical protein